MNKVLANLIALIAITIVFTSDVNASYGQYGQYDEPAPNFSVMIDKMVGKPVMTKGGEIDSDYVDNLSASDVRFSAGQEVFFKIKVKNTSEAKLKGITIKDFLPEFVEPIEGVGTYNNESREITINAGDLEVDEEKIFVIKTRILPQEQLPADQGIMCLVNRAQASSENTSDEDSTQFCVEKSVQGVTSVPSAGPELGLVLISGQIAALGLGMFLKRKVS